MYRSIAVAVDNSEYSRYAEDLAVGLARAFQAELTGYHVYAGKFHRMRFEALEEHLPPEYQKEDILDYQRKIHSVLIERGLEIISSEYMNRLREVCQTGKVPLHEVITDGNRSDILCDATSDNDLMVIGSQGVGRVKGTGGLGSTSERVVRNSSCDVLITRNGRDPRRILVGIDGSEVSSASLERALDIGERFDAGITLLSSHNPLLHRSVFELLSATLSRQAGQVFHFQEQEALHTMIIDRSLNDLYQRHLDRGCERAERRGLAVQTCIATGTPWHALCTEASEGDYDLVVTGRFGMHRGRYDTIGSNTMRVAERAMTNVLIVGGTGRGAPASIPSREPVPATDLPSLVWTEEANERLKNVPSFARPMALLAIERYAREKGITTITPDVMIEARKKTGL